MIKKMALFFMCTCMFLINVFAQLTDRKATKETKNLYKNLQHLYGKEVLFGHQDDMAYGVGWKYEEGRSDIKDLTGEYPAVFGFDVSGLEKDSKLNIDGVPFDKMHEYIRKAYDLGLITTLSWHMDNPLNGKNSWDSTPNSVRSILPGGSKHSLYTQWLNKFVVFVQKLNGSDGKSIPVLFRPFHELNGDWFWWGSKTCTAEEYKSLFQFTVKYLRDVKQLHNIIYVYNPCGFKTEAEYLERYPGNAFADVLSFDDYQYGGVSNGAEFTAGLIKKLEIQSLIAKRLNKIAAIAEIGYVEIPDPIWWTNVVAKAIEKNKPSFMLFWRNAGYREKEKDNHYYAPYPGQLSAADFLNLIKHKKVLLQKGLNNYQVYK